MISINLTAYINVSCFGGSDGSIDVSVTGGTPSANGYRIEWIVDPDNQPATLAPTGEPVGEGGDGEAPAQGGAGDDEPAQGGITRSPESTGVEASTTVKESFTSSISSLAVGKVRVVVHDSHECSASLDIETTEPGIYYLLFLFICKY